MGTEKSSTTHLEGSVNDSSQFHQSPGGQSHGNKYNVRHSHWYPLDVNFQASSNVDHYPQLSLNQNHKKQLPFFGFKNSPNRLLKSQAHLSQNKASLH